MVKDVKADTLKRFILERVQRKSTLMTDEWSSYDSLNNHYEHKKVSHGQGEEYVNGNTNTMEGFWTLFKRGFIGQYHQLKSKYMNLYLDEFCFRYNNRKNDNVFFDVFQKGVLA